MDGVRFSDVFWVALAAFGGFELALAANYLFLKLLVRAISPQRHKEHKVHQENA
jgi:hypothetical protein